MTTLIGGVGRTEAKCAGDMVSHTLPVSVYLDLTHVINRGTKRSGLLFGSNQPCRKQRGPQFRRSSARLLPSPASSAASRCGSQAGGFVQDQVRRDDRRRWQGQRWRDVRPHISGLAVEPHQRTDRTIGVIVSAAGQKIAHGDLQPGVSQMLAMAAAGERRATPLRAGAWQVVHGAGDDGRARARRQEL